LVQILGYLGGARDVPNPNNSDESEFIRKRIVPFHINRIEIMNIRTRLLINRIGVCGIRVIPIRNRIHSVNIPYEPNNTEYLKGSKIYMFLNQLVILTYSLLENHDWLLCVIFSCSQ